ncbi:hypothetical protein SDC9_124361 [bioreactor metagenome]|uniref:Uncharacterized protein n=1 Tax=bioreactor metagenome TaxID=1076179 RepID=A0A645CKC5_9ZZZZ
MGDKGLGGGVNRHPGVGAESRDGGHIQNPPAPGEIGKRQAGDGGKGPQVQIDHAGLEHRVRLAQIAPITHARVIHQQKHLRLLGQKLFLKHGKAHGVAQIQPQTQGRAGEGLCQLLQPVPSPGDEPKLLYVGIFGNELAGKFPAQPRGRAGDNGDFHKTRSLSFEIRRLCA